MSTLFLTHFDCLNHVTPPGHPERVARLEAILNRMSEPDFAGLVRLRMRLERSLRRGTGGILAH
ncbi:MAG: hypothetical protein AAFU59_14815, partial [Pseudomonadota bacterium]